MKTDLKKTNAETMAITRNVREFDKDTDNIYESVVIMSKRADQISLEIKDEMQKEIQEVAPATDSLEEVFENREQIELSKFFEQLPKPTQLALYEFENGLVYFKDPETNE